MAASLQAKSPIKRRSRPARAQRAPSRRRLFEAEATTCGSEVQEAGPAPSCPEPCDEPMQRQDSTATALNTMGSPTVQPSTPDYPAAATSRSLPTWDAAREGPLCAALQGWRAQLVHLQPLVRLGDEVLLGALAAVRQLAVARPDLVPALAHTPARLHAFLASALWTVGKLSAVRTQIPNRSLVAQATGVAPQALSACEMQLLQGLDWDIASLLRSHGLL